MPCLWFWPQTNFEERGIFRGVFSRLLTNCWPSLTSVSFSHSARPWIMISITQVMKGFKSNTWTVMLLRLKVMVFPLPCSSLHHHRSPPPFYATLGPMLQAWRHTCLMSYSLGLSGFSCCFCHRDSSRGSWIPRRGLSRASNYLLPFSCWSSTTRKFLSNTVPPIYFSVQYFLLFVYVDLIHSHYRLVINT